MDSKIHSVLILLTLNQSCIPVHGYDTVHSMTAICIDNNHGHLFLRRQILSADNTLGC